MDDLNEFLDAKRSQFEAARSQREKDGVNPTYTMRLRVRVGDRFNVEGLTHSMTIGGRVVVLSARNPGRPLKDAEWVVLKSEFEGLDDAIAFGNDLQTSLAVAAARRRRGIDVGHKNKATSKTSEDIKNMFFRKGIAMLDDVHGVTVYPNDMATTVIGGEAHMIALLAPTLLSEEVATLIPEIQRIDEKHRNAILMLNAAALNNEPLAKLAFAVAAVEMLANVSSWSPSQKKAIEALKESVLSHPDLDSDEANMIGAALDRLHNQGVNEACRKLIMGLGLEVLLKPWSKFYSKRSSIFHGSKPAIDADLVSYSDEALILCSRIVLAAVGRQLPRAASDIENLFPTPIPAG